MSAWGFTDRAAFEDGVAALKSATAPDHRLKRLPKLLSPPIALPKTNDSELPANVEFQLAQDFAFLAAWENLPGCVAAATVTQNDEAVGVRVAMAANEGIERPVKNSFRQILENMQKCASCRTLHLQVASLPGFSGLMDSDLSRSIKGEVYKRFARHCRETASQQNSGTLGFV